ncbi:MAG TPA: hypothetical protein HPP50_09465 [Rhodospirillaceae bacterium]|nr:hypothetical protein [Rhodospirillales bacterium]HIJ42573.1 hypothetical protein [Rhodospirillaceae bacterium]HIJ46359.1 hypothetical protein [Rhodospirillaceae bacterium]HIJ92518.1 hypothetical protein [Rhodospirillaceae bacterium]
MIFHRCWFVLSGTLILLPACDVMWPSLTGEEPAGTPPTPRVSQSPALPQARPIQPQPLSLPAAPSVATVPGVNPPPRLGDTDFQPPGVTPGASTGTFVGKKVEELREELKALMDSVSQHNSELQQLRARMVQDSQRYHGTIAAVNTRLQVGTTPGNPILVRKYNSAQADLDRISADIGEMNKLATAATGDSTMSAFLSESTRAAFGVSGAIDDDHRQLAILEDEVNRTVVLIERLLKEVSDDVRRQTNYVASERRNLNVLAAGVKGGEIFGSSLITHVAAAGSGPPEAARPTDTSGRRALVVIRFDRANVPYQQALYAAVSRVLERRPNAIFDLVAVAPSGGGPARVALNSTKSRRLAEDVLRSLVEMGLPPTRVAVSGKTSGGAKTNEVHLYLR